MYKKYFTHAEINEVKASEIRDLKKQESVAGLVILLLLFMAFLTFMSLVALILWFGKATLFIFVIMLVPTVMFFVSLRALMKAYKKMIEKIKTRIKEGGR